VDLTTEEEKFDVTNAVVICIAWSLDRIFSARHIKAAALLTKRRERLSKRGNAYLRKRLYSAGWGAIMNYEQFRTYYETLKEKGLYFVNQWMRKGTDNDDHPATYSTFFIFTHQHLHCVYSSFLIIRINGHAEEEALSNSRDLVRDDVATVPKLLTDHCAISIHSMLSTHFGLDPNRSHIAYFSHVQDG
jgi:hypothetical protein